MSAQLFYLEDLLADVSLDYINIINNEYKELNNEKTLTQEEVIKNINIEKHLKCSVPDGMPLFQIATISSEEHTEVTIECACCNNILYELKK